MSGFAGTSIHRTAEVTIIFGTHRISGAGNFNDFLVNIPSIYPEKRLHHFKDFFTLYVTKFIDS